MNEKGNISLLEKSRIEALLLSLSQERNTADNEIVALQGDLKLLLGLSNDESFEPLLDENVLGKIDTRVVSFAELNDRMSVRPDMKLIQAGIRASKRLAQVVPVSIAIIFIILFVLFGNARDAGCFEPWYRFGKPASACYRHYWRTNRCNVLYPFCIPVNCRGFLPSYVI